MLFIKVFSNNVNNGKKYVCGVNKTNNENLIRTVGQFYITFDKNTKESFDMYYKNFKYEEISKEEEENHINHLKSLKIIDGVLSDSIRKVIECFGKEDLNQEGNEVYDSLYFLITECLEKEGIDKEFIIKDGGVYNLVTKIEEDTFCLENLKLTRLPDYLF